VLAQVEHGLRIGDDVIFGPLDGDDREASITWLPQPWLLSWMSTRTIPSACASSASAGVAHEQELVDRQVARVEAGLVLLDALAARLGLTLHAGGVVGHGLPSKFLAAQTRA
jgi:hypothetical protein